MYSTPNNWNFNALINIQFCIFQNRLLRVLASFTLVNGTYRYSMNELDCSSHRKSQCDSTFRFYSHSNFSGVHHKKKNCESNQVISKVQQVLRIATKSHQLYPKTLTLTVASVVKKSKLRKGNGGWSDVRDHNLCMNVTWAS